MPRCQTIAADVPDPCPRKVPMGESRSPRCTFCVEDLIERSALIEFGGMGLSRDEANKLAAQQAAESMRGQRALKL